MKLSKLTVQIDLPEKLADDIRDFCNAMHFDEIGIEEDNELIFYDAGTPFNIREYEEFSEIKKRWAGLQKRLYDWFS
jgi:hypothetical protein